jgi:DNA-binding response OmpR family regulator
MKEKIRVLLVDDEARFALSISKILNRRGFDAEAVFDGFQALEKMRSEAPFDVVVLDLKMPGMDGITALEEIKKRAPETEVILLTGHGTVDTGIQAIRKGAYDYLLKPCDIEDLIEKIKEAHERERIRQSPVLWPRNRVGDCTLPSFKKLLYSDPLSAALDAFHRRTYKTGAETVFIQDENDLFVGQVTKRDLLEAAGSAHPDRSITWAELLSNPQLLPDRPLRSVMRSDPPQTASPADSLTDTAHRMISGNTRCMPVTAEGKVLGIVRLKDILQHIEREIE